jgi:hypothetical protein
MREESGFMKYVWQVQVVPTLRRRIVAILAPCPGSDLKASAQVTEIPARDVIYKRKICGKTEVHPHPPNILTFSRLTIFGGPHFPCMHFVQSICAFLR